MCNTSLPAPEKLKYAGEWKVPIVSSNWLWDSIENGEFKPFDAYIIRHSENQLPTADSEISDNKVEIIKSGSRTNFLNPLTAGDKKRLLLGRTLDLANGEEGAQLIDDDPSSRVIEDSPMKKQVLHLDSNGTSDIHTETDSANPDECQDSFAPPLGAISAPLKEISLNSSPKASLSPSKIIAPSSKSATSVQLSDDSLGPAISSLLAHHQRLAATNLTTKLNDDAKIGRRRRQLLGRAPSSLSARSNGSVNFSRASSVDTMNTDGLGTPLETPTTHTRDEVDESFAILHGLSEKESFRESIEQPLQMTQLGYEDPDVRAWRDRAIKKLGGACQIDLDTEKRVEGIGVVTDVGGRGARGVGRRTRQALGR